MGTILRKIIELASNRPSSVGSDMLRRRRRSMPPTSVVSNSLGAFENIPQEVLMQILSLLGPKDAVKMSLVCTSLKLLVSDDHLWIYFLQNNNHPHTWESVLFAETHLRLGHPIQQSPRETHRPSFMSIYSQRVQVPGSVIIDGGSGYCKFGWSKYDCPSGRSTTFLEFGNIESPMHSRLRHFFATIYSRMQVKPSLQPVVVSIPLCHYDDTESAKASRRQLKEAILSILFEMHVPAVCALNQATLALYALRQTSGISVNIGFQVTSVVPILNGKVMRKVGVEAIGMGALKLSSFLRDLLLQKNISFESMYTVRALKEKLCYVAADYDAELRKNTEAWHHIPGEGLFTLSEERFKTGEMLFEPSLGGVRAMGLHRAVALCMDHCHEAEVSSGDGSWFKTVLSGGTASLPGLAERLEKELHKLLPPEVGNGIRVISSPYGADTAWFGAKQISNLSSFPAAWCVTKKQFRHKSRFNLIW